MSFRASCLKDPILTRCKELLCLDILGVNRGKFQLSSKHHFSFCQLLNLEGEERTWNGRAFLGLNLGFGIITLQNLHVLPLSRGMDGPVSSQRLFSSSGFLWQKRRERKKISLAKTTKKFIRVKCKEQGNRSKTKENYVPYMFSNGLSL